MQRTIWFQSSSLIFNLPEYVGHKGRTISEDANAESDSVSIIVIDHLLEDVGHEGRAVGKDANVENNLVQIIVDHLPKDVGHERSAVGEDANAESDSVPIVVVDRLLRQSTSSQMQNGSHNQHRFAAKTEYM